MPRLPRLYQRLQLAGAGPAREWHELNRCHWKYSSCMKDQRRSR
jgi:hypothetical protein